MPKFGTKSKQRLGTCHTKLQRVFNEVTKSITDKLSTKFETSKDWLADSESAKKELDRRLILLQVVEDIRKTPGL